MAKNFNPFSWIEYLGMFCYLAALTIGAAYFYMVWIGVLK